MPSNLRYGAFDEKKKQQGLRNAISAPPPRIPIPEPQVSIPGSVIDPRSPLGRKQGLVDPSAVVVVDQAPPSEMDGLGQRFGFGLGSARPDTDNEAAQSGFLARGQNQDFGMQDYVPEGGTDGDYLAIMARDGQNEAIGVANRGIVSREQESDQIRQAQIQNALKQDAAYQKMAIEAREAEMQDEFFRANGIIPSPRAMAEFQKQLGRQTATAQFVEALSGLAAKKAAKYKQLLAGYENLQDEELPLSIRRAKAQIDAEFDRQEQMIGMASGLQSGINNPSNMIPRDDSGLR